MNNQAEYKSHKRMLAIILAVGVVLFGVKLWLYFVTNSNAVLSDALESTVNIVAGALALYSFILAHKPSDKKHPYGHGKIEFLSASLEGALILTAGIIIIVKSIISFYTPEKIEALDLGISVTLITGGINALMGFLLISRGKRKKSLLMKASGKHLLSDAYTSAGLILGLVIIWLTGIQWLDGVVAIVFGLIIIYSAYKILHEAIDGIMDGADFQTLEHLVTHLQSVRRDDWIDIHKMRMIKYGTSVHVDCHMTVPRFYSVEQAHVLVDDVEMEIARACEGQSEVFIHVDACIAASCTHCRMTNCQIRSQQKSVDLFWRLDDVLENKKLGL
ncbi:MAG: cation transporter [Crocinitomicaceae bacterium]|nr:cation transporter [Crocinitomicaceae bacterium]